MWYTIDESIVLQSPMIVRTNIVPRITSYTCPADTSHLIEQNDTSRGKRETQRAEKGNSIVHYKERRTAPSMSSIQSTKMFSVLPSKQISNNGDHGSHDSNRKEGKEIQKRVETDKEAVKQ